MPTVGKDGEIIGDDGKPTGYFIKTPESGVRTPAEVGQSAKGFIKRNIVPAGVMGATGLALDYFQPEIGVPLTLGQAALRALGGGALMGAENVAMTKKLPPALGGNPETPAGLSFLAGAVPEILVGVPGMLRGALRGRLNRAASSAAERGVEKLDPEALVTREALMAPKSRIPFPSRDVNLTDVTSQAREPVLSTIQTARTKYGAPIGDAYRLLKGDKPVDASGFAQWVDNVRAQQIAPAPAAQKYLEQLRNMDPEVQKKAAEAASAGAVESPLIELPGGEMVRQRSAPPSLGLMSPDDLERYRNTLKLQGFSDKQIENTLKRLGKTEQETKPPTLDRLRDMRQRVNTELRTARGGDLHQLGEIQDHLDQILMEHLPENMQGLRKQYAGFINRWGYRAQHELERLQTPQEVSDWLFKDPARAHDLMTEAVANPQQAEQMRDLFIQHVYGPLNDTTMSEAQQLTAVRENLAPYVKDPATARLVLGRNPGDKIQQMMKWPRFTQDFSERFSKDPQFRTGFESGIKSLIMKGEQPDQAAQRMIMNLTQGDPEFAKIVQQTMPQLPAPAAKQGAGSLNPMTAAGIIRHGALLGLGGLTGHMMGAEWQVGMLGSYLIYAPMRAFMNASKLGITVPLLNAMGERNGYFAGKQVARALLALGARKEQERVMMDASQ